MIPNCPAARGRGMMRTAPGEINGKGSACRAWRECSRSDWAVTWWTRRG
jgi:hypothetical protein